MDEYLITREPQTPDYRIERDSEGSKLKDVALSFGTGANSLLQMAGDFYGLATGDMDNTASRQARENIENLQRQKSPELQQAEQGRRDAIDAESDELGKALTYIRLTATDPLLLSTAIGEQLPSLVGTGGVGVVAKKGAEKLLLKTAANQAAKSLAAKKAAQIGTGAAVAAGAGIGGTDVAAGLYDEAVQSLDSISDEQAMSIPEIAKIVDERDATIDEAKAAFALTLGRQAFAVAAPISVGAQMLPGGRTIERAFVGRQVAKPIGGALAGAIGEAASEAVEEGGGKIASNILARKFDPERPIARGVGEAVGQAALVGGIPGGAAGLIFARPDSTSRPVSEGETLAGMSGQPPMPAATKPSIAPQQEATLERSEDLTPEQFWATINVRQASLLGGKPDPEDVALVGEVAPLRTEADPDEVNRVLDEASVALNNWSSDNPNAPENITLIFDPEMLHNGFGVQGAFNPKDGSILINTAFVTPENVGTIVNHEWAHATLATDEGRQALADFASREIPQEELDALATRYGTQDRIAILEEWIAGNQEKAPGVVSRIVTQIREWLSGFGIVDLTDAEVADIMLRTLREQAENRIQPDTYGTMQPTEGDRFSLSSELTPTEENLIRTADETSEPTRSTSKSRFYVTSDERGRDFADAIARAAQDHPRGAAVEVKPTEFYSDPENALFLSEDGLAGAVVKSDGDLVSVFKHPTSKTRMKELLADASEQATKLDAFDIDSYLPQLYSNFGFRPVARVAFNDEYAPPGWNFEDMGRPDVVLMVKDRDNVLGLPDATLYTDEVREQVPLVSYDEAVRLQQGAIDRLSEKPAVDPKSPDIRYSLSEEPVGVSDLPRNLKGDSEGFIPTYITKQNALPTVVVGKNKTVEVPVIDFGQYADRVFKARGQSEFAGKNITLAEAHVPVIQKYYAGLSPETYRTSNVRTAADLVARDMSNNLLFLHDLALDLFGPEVVKRMSKWYDGANVIAKTFADKYDISIEQSAAILATLSPQKHWFANVSLAENVMDVMRNHQNTVFDAAIEKAARQSIKDSTGTTSSKRVLYAAIRAVSGKKLSDLKSLEEKTVFTRFLSQSLHPERAYIVTPEGQLTPGSSVAVAWSGIPISSNAVSAFLDGSVDNLTKALGGGHKVRNFNGNIIDPMSPLFYTSDTHNVAASLLIPVGGTDFEVSHNFGGNPGVGEGPKLPVVGTTITGLQGTYPLYLEAGRRAAEQRNVLPRQMQSITWEMIRIMFTDNMKTPALMSSVKRVHDQVRDGSLNVDDAYKKIIELSGGRDVIKARPPEWLTK